MENDFQETPDEVESHTVGSILRRCREFSQISIEDAAETTKIGKNYLRAMEDDRFQDLPSPAYLKGFLKTYASYLGLQADELIQLASQQESGPPVEPQKAELTRQMPGGFNWQRLILPATLLVALIISAIIMAPPPFKRLKSPVPQPPLTGVSVVAVQSGVQPVHSSGVLPAAIPAASKELTLENPAESSVVPPKPRDGFMIRMKVNRNSLLSVAIDDGVSQGYDLTSGDLIEWKASRTIALELSDAGSIDIELNGMPVKLQTPSGKPAYIVLDANGIKQQ